MRGKLVIVGMAFLGVLFYVYSIWFLSNPSAVDQRFDMRREKLPADVPGAVLLRQKFGDHTRISFVPVENDAQGVLRGSAQYTELDDPNVLTLEVQQITAAESPTVLQTLYAQLKADGRAVLLDQGVTKYLFHKPADGRATFIWLNGQWLFRAYSAKADDEALLRFVNNYPF